jgi:plastocyanin
VTWQVANAPSTDAADVMRFIPQRLSIKTGDTVTWDNETPVPHTVTFTSGAAAPELITPQPQNAGPPNLVLNPDVLFPAGAANGTYDGTGYVNSGFFGAGPESVAGTSFSLTFTKPGTYLYLCVLHADQGMSGVIEVSAGGGITPPSTGDAGIAGQGHTVNLALVGVLSVLAVFVAGPLAMAIRRH